MLMKLIGAVTTMAAAVIAFLIFAPVQQKASPDSKSSTIENVRARTVSAIAAVSERVANGSEPAKAAPRGTQPDAAPDGRDKATDVSKSPRQATVPGGSSAPEPSIDEALKEPESGGSNVRPPRGDPIKDAVSNFGAVGAGIARIEKLLNSDQ